MVCSQPLDTSGVSRTPWAPSILPQAPKPVDLSRHRVGLSLTGVASFFGLAGWRACLNDAFVPRGNPSAALGPAACSYRSSRQATWRRAQVCTLPLSLFGRDRAPRPPPLQHRVPIRSSRGRPWSTPRFGCRGELSLSLDGPKTSDRRRMSLSTLLSFTDVARWRD